MTQFSLSRFVPFSFYPVYHFAYGRGCVIELGGGLEHDGEDDVADGEMGRTVLLGGDATEYFVVHLAFAGGQRGVQAF